MPFKLWNRPRLDENHNSRVVLRERPKSFIQRFKDVFSSKLSAKRRSLPNSFNGFSHHHSSNSGRHSVNCFNYETTRHSKDNNELLLFPSELMQRRPDYAYVRRRTTNDCHTLPPMRNFSEYPDQCLPVVPRRGWIDSRNPNDPCIIVRNRSSGNDGVHFQGSRYFSSSRNVVDGYGEDSLDSCQETRPVSYMYDNSSYEGPEDLYANFTFGGYTPVHPSKFVKRNSRTLPGQMRTAIFESGVPLTDDEIILRLPSLTKFNNIHNANRLPIPQRRSSSLSRGVPGDFCQTLRCARCSCVIPPQTPGHPYNSITIPDLYRPKKIPNLADELYKLSKHGWYWGPISRLEAEERLKEQPDGSFLVRDSSDDFLLLSLYVRSVGRTLFVRIEYGDGKFSLNAIDPSKWHSSVTNLIQYSMKISQFRPVCYTKPHAGCTLSYPVRLINPISRFCEVRSLKYLSRFVIRYHTRLDQINMLPLPKTLIDYVGETCY